MDPMFEGLTLAASGGKKTDQASAEVTQWMYLVGAGRTLFFISSQQPKKKGQSRKTFLEQIYSHFF
jgi:hypothetical protein